jgi:hypothetical protein
MNPAHAVSAISKSGAAVSQPPNQQDAIRPASITHLLVIVSPRNEGVAIQLAGLLRRCASANELTSFVVAKEPRRLRQSTGAIDQLDRHVASLLAMTIAKMVHCPITQRLGVGARSRDDR